MFLLLEASLRRRYGTEGENHRTFPLMISPEILQVSLPVLQIHREKKTVDYKKAFFHVDVYGFFKFRLFKLNYLIHCGKSPNSSTSF